MQAVEEVSEKGIIMIQRLEAELILENCNIIGV